MLWSYTDAWNCFKFEKWSVLIKVMIESDTLISCFISMLNDSFDIKSFTVDIILNNLEKIFQFLALIDINTIDMTFIDEFLISELCECFDIQSVSLSKSKWI